MYNLTVEGAHEYYANGILVSNCDAIRYLTIARSTVRVLHPRPPRQVSAHELRGRVVSAQERFLRGGRR